MTLRRRVSALDLRQEEANVLDGSEDDLNEEGIADTGRSEELDAVGDCARGQKLSDKEKASRGGTHRLQNDGQYCNHLQELARDSQKLTPDHC